MLQLYSIVLWGIYGVSALVLALLLFVTAPYGRYNRGGWGISIKPRWAWFVMESPAAIVILAMAALGRERGLYPLIFLGMWEFHYVYRSFVYPFLMRQAGPKNFPVVIILMAMLYNCANGFVNGYFLFRLPHAYPPGYFVDPRFALGVLLFFAGFFIHASSDSILRSLRSGGEGGGAYAIPYGGMFRFVSSPNYFGEILQWSGFALASWSVAGLSFAVFTLANLLPRGLSHHRWYRERFPDYPAERRAVLPFLL